MKEIGLYIHIPFCISKCLYCDFVSFASMEDKFSAYKNRLLGEIKKAELLKNYTIKTIFIGGGTPSVLPPDFIAEILSSVTDNYNVDKNAEITIEANPGTLDIDKLNVYANSGVNRISLGLQSSSNRLLKILGRLHTWEQFLESYNNILKTSIKNVNIDLMFGLPQQSLRDLEQTIDAVLALKVRHISAYGLILEEGTRLYDMYSEAPEELDREMYYLIKNKLKGFNHYEISNFALDGFECRHNILYWTRQEYLGLGMAAHSFVNNERFFNTSDLEKYLNGVTVAETPVKIEAEEARSEFLFLGLRMIAGVSISQFEKNFNVPLFGVYGKQIDRLVKEGLLVKDKDNDRIYLTGKGIDLSNLVFAEFV